MTKECFSRQTRFCCDKTFVATKMILVAAPANDTRHFQCLLGYFDVAIIHRTLTWTTGSLTCVCGLYACAYTLGTSVNSLIRRSREHEQTPFQIKNWILIIISRRTNIKWWANKCLSVLNTATQHNNKTFYIFYSCLKTIFSFGNAKLSSSHIFLRNVLRERVWKYLHSPRQETKT